jgi:hypothetical protein
MLFLVRVIERRTEDHRNKNGFASAPTRAAGGVGAIIDDLHEARATVVRQIEDLDWVFMN